MASHVGLRVVRGQPWTLDKRGSSVLLVGTITSYNVRGKMTYVTVKWDNGVLCDVTYPGQNHLMVLDSTPLGIVHHNKHCATCGISIKGFLWSCTECKTLLCNICYHGHRGHKAELRHNYKRFDSPNDEHGKDVGRRKDFARTRVNGIFKKAEVVDARILKSKGSKTLAVGTVAAIPRDADELYPQVVVEFGHGQDGLTFQLGREGKAELACVKAADGGEYYISHLPAPWELEVPQLAYESVDVTNITSPSGQGVRDRLGPAPQPPGRPKGMAPPPPVSKCMAQPPPVSKCMAQPPPVSKCMDPPPPANRRSEVQYDVACAVERTSDGLGGDEADVITDYTPTDPTHLRLRIGDIVNNVKHVGGNLMYGELHGKTGLFPDHCAQTAYVTEAEIARQSQQDSDSSSQESYLLPTQIHPDSITTQIQPDSITTQIQPDSITTQIHPGQVTFEDDLPVYKETAFPGQPSRVPTKVMKVPPFTDAPSKPPREPVLLPSPKVSKVITDHTASEEEDDEDEDVEDEDVEEDTRVEEIEKAKPTPKLYPNLAMMSMGSALKQQLSVELAEAVKKPKVAAKPKPTFAIHERSRSNDGYTNVIKTEQPYKGDDDNKVSGTFSAVKKENIPKKKKVPTATLR